MFRLRDTKPRPAPAAPAELPLPVLTRIVGLAPVGVIVSELREEEPLVFVNRAFQEITGYDAADVLGKNCRYLQGNDRMQPQIAQIRQAIAERNEVSVTLRNYRKDGGLFWNQLRLAPVGHRNGEPTHYIGLMQDVTRSKEMLAHIEKMLRVDQLTGALNRDGFLDQLQRSLGELAAVPMMIKVDIARFHDINIGFGYEVGDLLLAQVADRLDKIPGAIIGRLNSNEFGVAVSLARRDEAETVLAVAVAALTPRFVVPGAEIDVRFGLGYAVGEPKMDALSLLRRAGAALHESRSTKLREIRRSDDGGEVQSRNRIRMATELQQALANHEFVFEYQPKVELATCIPIGAEALLRWKHGLFGQQQPDRFIGVAEDTGFILDIGTWGIRTASRFAAEMNLGLARKLGFAVNVSTMEFIHRDIVRLVAESLEESGADPAWLTLELTESLMAESSPRMLDIFRSLRELGVGLALDDFGTGYSSLRYLETFPVTEVKLDRSFVQGMRESAAKRIIVEAVIRLARELGMSVVAEGIETEAERSILCEMGCLFGQGYLFSRPVPADIFAALVRDGAPLGPKPSRNAY